MWNLRIYVQINRCIPVSKMPTKSSALFYVRAESVLSICGENGDNTHSWSGGKLLYPNIMAPSERQRMKGLQDLHNVAEGLNARVQQCNLKDFPWVCARMCHKTCKKNRVSWSTSHFLWNTAFGSNNGGSCAPEVCRIYAVSFIHRMNTRGKMCFNCVILFFIETRHINRHAILLFCFIFIFTWLDFQADFELPWFFSAVNYSTY